MKEQFEQLTVEQFFNMIESAIATSSLKHRTIIVPESYYERTSEKLDADIDKWLHDNDNNLVVNGVIIVSNFESSNLYLKLAVENLITSLKTEQFLEILFRNIPIDPESIKPLIKHLIRQVEKSLENHSIVLAFAGNINPLTSFEKFVRIILEDFIDQLTSFYNSEARRIGAELVLPDKEIILYRAFKYIYPQVERRTINMFPHELGKLFKQNLTSKLNVVDTNPKIKIVSNRQEENIQYIESEQNKYPILTTLLGKQFIYDIYELIESLGCTFQEMIFDAYSSDQMCSQLNENQLKLLQTFIEECSRNFIDDTNQYSKILNFIRAQIIGQYEYYEELKKNERLLDRTDILNRVLNAVKNSNTPESRIMAVKYLIYYFSITPQSYDYENDDRKKNEIIFRNIDPKRKLPPLMI